MKLWRPVGHRELARIKSTGMSAFPARLPEQPIFYPVLSFDYAEKIARDWNSVRVEHDFLGFVVAFDLDDAYAAQFCPQSAGGKTLKELWLPAEALDAFNDHIANPIEIVAAYVNGLRVRNAYADGDCYA